MFEITGKTVILTGSAGGLGQGIVKVFHQAGAKLVLADHANGRIEKLFPELADSSDVLMVSSVDVTKTEDMARLISTTTEKFGTVDVLINAVGGYKAGKPLHETSLETWESMMNLNAKSVFTACKAILPIMLKNGGGRIINVAAKPALQAPANHSAYSASKSAVARLTEAMAAEYKNDGITVNAVLPSMIDTPANRKSMPNADFSKWVTPEAIAQVMVFLASPASEAINGALIPVYGRS